MSLIRLLFVFALLVSCSDRRHGDSLLADSTKNLDQNFGRKDSIAEVDSTINAEAEEYHEPEERELQIGAVLPNLEDNTLLTFVYGSCYKKEDVFVFNDGPQIWYEQDSVYMKVNSILGTDSSVIVYIIGEAAITCANHNQYYETTLALSLKEDGWHVTDGYLDEISIDFHSVSFVGEFFDRLLIRYETFGVYAGGVAYGDVSYTLLEKEKVTGLEVNFMKASSNTASEQCFNDGDYPDYHCDCYSREGNDTLRFDSNLQALVFDYAYESTTGDCEMKDSVNTFTTQRWYMNTDTCFMGKGHYLSDWGETIEEEINLSDREIKARLKIE